ncbi:unnamed protein product [Amoebophrya sp. A120]|nr:unnamed protein product [Amoebophrya sp. A120]|eukprot:GSA120T00023577001.1
MGAGENDPAAVEAVSVEVPSETQKPEKEGRAELTLQEMLEKLLSKKNLAKDQFLRGCISPQMYVSVADLLKHDRICAMRKPVTEQDILAAAEHSAKLGVDLEQKLVRPMLRSKRNTIIVREFPYGEQVLKNDILGRLDESLRSQIVGIKADVCDTWFLKCASDDATQKIALFLRDQEYEGKKIQSAIKSEHFLRSFFPVHGVPPNNLIPLNTPPGNDTTNCGVANMMLNASPPMGAAGQVPNMQMQPMQLSPQPSAAPMSWGAEMFPASPVPLMPQTQPVLRVLAQVNGGSWNPWGHAHRQPRKLSMPSAEWLRKANKSKSKWSQSSWQQNKWNGNVANSQYNTGSLRNGYYSHEWQTRNQMQGRKQYQHTSWGIKNGSSWNNGGNAEHNYTNAGSSVPNKSNTNGNNVVPKHNGCATIPEHPAGEQEGVVEQVQDQVQDSKTFTPSPNKDKNKSKASSHHNNYTPDATTGNSADGNKSSTAPTTTKSSPQKPKLETVLAPASPRPNGASSGASAEKNADEAGAEGAWETVGSKKKKKSSPKLVVENKSAENTSPNGATEKEVENQENSSGATAGDEPRVQ